MKLRRAEKNFKKRTSLFLAVLMVATALMGPTMEALAMEGSEEENVPAIVETAGEQEASSSEIEPEPSEAPGPAEEPVEPEEPTSGEDSTSNEVSSPSEEPAPSVEPAPTEEPVQTPELEPSENGALESGSTETKFADQAESISLYRNPSQSDNESVGAAGGDREIYPADYVGRTFRSFQSGNAETVGEPIVIASPLYLDTQYDSGMVLPFKSWTVTVLQSSRSFEVSGPVLELDPQALIQEHQISKWTTGVEITANWGDPVSLESITGEPEETTYSVTFKYRNPTGEWIYSEPQKVKEGEAAQAPDIPKRPTAYVFKNWDKSFDHITADTEISAKYTRVQNVYTVNFYLSDKLLEAGYYYEGTYQLQGSIYDSHSYAGGSYCTLEGRVSGVTPSFTVRPKGPHTGDNFYAPFTFTVMNMTGGKYNGQTIASPVPDSDYGALGFYEMNRRSDFEKYGFKKGDVINISVDIINDPTVTFVDENGVQIGEAQTVTWGTSATAPEMEEGVFDHWELTPANTNLDCVRTNITAKAVVKEYTATFLQPDGTEIASQTVKTGEEIVPPAVTGGDGYNFKYWTENKKNQEVKFPQTMGKENRTFTAKYGDFQNSVGDLYVNDEKVGSVDLTESFLKNMLDSGAPGVYTGENGMFTLQPLVYANGNDLNSERKFGISWNVRDFNAGSKVFQQAGYTFTGTDKTSQVNEIAWESVEYTRGPGAWKIQAHMEITALHTVTFMGEDGSVLGTQDVVHGSAATAPEAPEVKGKKFTGWDRAFDNVTEDITVTAQYQQLTYTINYILDEELEGSYVLKNNGGTTYSVAADAYSRITAFGVWIKDKNTGVQNKAVSMELLNDVSGVSGNKEISFSAGTLISDFRNGNAYVDYNNGFGFTSFPEETVINIKVSAVKHQVQFIDADGTVLSTQNIIHGMAASAPQDPTAAGKTFAGWDKDFSNIVENTTVTAVYDTVLYTVVFLDINGEPITTQIVQYGESAVAPTAPEVEGMDFTGWDTDFSQVVSDLTVRAVYADQYFTVEFLNEQGGSLKTEQVKYGDGASAPTPPQIEGKTFVKWDVDFSKVTFNLTVRPVYEDQYFTVTFENENGEMLKTEKVKYGESASAPGIPEAEGKNFISWDSDFSKVTSDLTVRPVYADQYFTVKFLDESGKTLKTEEVKYGESASAPSIPEVEGKNFMSWDTDFSSVKSVLTVSAVYEWKTFTVTFLGRDNSLLKEETVQYGKSAAAPEAPYVSGMTFSKWDRDFSDVKEDLTVTAVYRSVPSTDVGGEDPVNPDTPVNPNEPVNPDTPNEPATPEVPNTPETPVNPVTPADPTVPETPATPAVTTPVAAPDAGTTVAPAAATEPTVETPTVTIPDEPVPLAKGGDNGNGYNLTTISDEQVPLAGSASEAHRFCILHFLILLMSLLLEIVYVISRNRNQKKLHELRKELEQ